MRSIVNNVRPDRQMLMFSATMKKKIEGFAREMLSKDEVRIVVGTIGQANPDIRQVAMILPNDTEKWVWLSSNIDEFCADGKVLIFVLSKAGTEEVAERLRKYLQARQLDVGVECLHGDKDQKERNSIMHRFGKNSSSDKGVTVLVATDIASRGLDVRDIRTVVNYDTAKNIETYVHRIGRTGRMGIEGVTPGQCVCLYACMFVCACVHLCLCVHVCACMIVCACVCACMFGFACVCMYDCVCMCVYWYFPASFCIYVHHQYDFIFPWGYRRYCKCTSCPHTKFSPHRYRLYSDPAQRIFLRC